MDPIFGGMLSSGIPVQYNSFVSDATLDEDFSRRDGDSEAAREYVKEGGGSFVVDSPSEYLPESTYEKAGSVSFVIDESSVSGGSFVVEDMDTPYGGDSEVFLLESELSDSDADVGQFVEPSAERVSGGAGVSLLSFLKELFERLDIES